MPRRNPNKGMPCKACEKPLTHGRIFCSVACSAKAWGDGTKGGVMGRPHPKTPRPTVSPTTADIAWAAGFIEGEGNIGRTTPVRSNSTERVTVRQMNREPLEKLQRLFGGRISVVTPKTTNLIKGCPKPINNWGIHGSLARGVMMTIFTFMSEARKRQVELALHPHRYSI